MFIFSCLLENNVHSYQILPLLTKYKEIQMIISKLLKLSFHNESKHQPMQRICFNLAHLLVAYLVFNSGNSSSRLSDVLYSIVKLLSYIYKLQQNSDKKVEMKIFWPPNSPQKCWVDKFSLVFQKERFRESNYTTEVSSPTGRYQHSSYSEYDAIYSRESV